MSNGWYKQQDYCTQCKRWSAALEHKDCPRGPGSTKWVNLITGQSLCDKCGEIGPVEDCVYYCSCGNVQEMIYSDSAVVIGYGDQVIAMVDNMVYVRRRSGAVVVGKRQVHTMSYQL